ncbi:unnamed protein product [Zymoseptoria tritici ST99CH_1A5]|uniref:Uncharacterized protein n=1 Tax=Zymoseptoria tritici ST99CH_1A5 TaxID=1276529 RepID=A0A1Y6LMN1_ZYMTR|nr:unnamed protein product [Zymoseptoria tritici ST99CH_1A5]
MDGIRNQIFANLRVACPSYTRPGNSTEIVIRFRDGLFYACVCGGADSNRAPEAGIMGPGAHAPVEAMEGLLVTTCCLVEARCAHSFARSTGQITAKMIEGGFVSRSAAEETVRED